MSLLFSNLPPLRTSYKNYTDVFENLIKDSDSVSIATGYISADSAVDLKNIVEINGGPRIDLCVGMHFFDGLTPTQMQALESLDAYLRDSDLGQVHMVTTFPFHGKVVSFSKEDNVLGSIIGSSNLSNIVNGHRQYEADMLFTEGVPEADQLNEFIQQVIVSTAKPFSELDNLKIVTPKNNLLKDHLGVTTVSRKDIDRSKNNLSDITFSLPLKGDVSNKSGLNASFGKGRINVQGFILPRSWYEVELIIPKNITELEHYPQADSEGYGGSFKVMTDDGWSFDCKVSGDFSKNFRSDGDLKILGKWLKGRMENKGALTPGDKVTDAALKKYGRSNINFTKINNSNTWFMDFGV